MSVELLVLRGRTARGSPGDLKIWETSDLHRIYQITEPVGPSTIRSRTSGRRSRGTSSAASASGVFSTSIVQSAKERGQRANCRRNRGDHRADDPGGQRKLRDRLSLLLDDDPPDIPFVDDAPELRQDLSGIPFDRFRTASVSWRLLAVDRFRPSPMATSRGASAAL